MALSSLAPGLLLAAPWLVDPNFGRAVVLLANHGEQGGFGWVLNGRPIGRLSDLRFGAHALQAGRVSPLHERFDVQTRAGGPVKPGSAWVLFKRQRASEPEFLEELELGKGLAITSDVGAIEAVARGEGPALCRILQGYAGWGPGQLEGEIRAGDWLPATLDVSILLSQPAEAIWDLCYRMAVGTSPIAFATSPRGTA